MGMDAQASATAAVPRLLAMGIFLRPAANFNLLLGSKKEIEGNDMLVVPYISCTICPFFSPPFLAFILDPLEVT